MKNKTRYFFIIYFLFQIAFFTDTILVKFVKKEVQYNTAVIGMGIFFFLIYTLFLSMQSSLVQGAKLEAEVSLLKQQQKLKARQDSELLTRKMQTVRFQRDMQEKLIVFRTLLSGGQSTEAARYLKNITSEFQEMRFRPCCSDSLVNAILDSKRQAAQALGIRTDYEILLPKDSAIASTDLSCIFFNLLDNGMEACAASGALKPFIRLSADCSRGFLTIHMENSKNPGERFSYASTKTDGLSHGLGLSIIEETVSKYDGAYEWKDKKEVFDSLVVLRYNIDANTDKEVSPC